MHALTEVKGTNFRGLLDALERRHGRSAVERTTKDLAGEVGELVRTGSLLSGGWYPARWYGALHAAAQRATGGGVELSFELAREGVKRDLGGIYRLLTFVLTPESMLRKAPSVFSTYFRNAQMVVVEAADGAGTIRFECRGFDPSLWADLEGGCVGVIEACGGSSVVARRLGGGRHGDDQMLVEVRWSR